MRVGGNWTWLEFVNRRAAVQFVGFLTRNGSWSFDDNPAAPVADPQPLGSECGAGSLPPLLPTTSTKRRRVVPFLFQETPRQANRVLTLPTPTVDTAGRALTHRRRGAPHFPLCDLLLHKSQCSVPPMAAGVLVKRLNELRASELRPQRFGDHKFGVADLPQQEVAQAHFTTGTD